MAAEVHVTTAPTAAPDPVPHRWRTLAVMTGVEVIDNTEGGVTTTIFPSIAKALSLDTGHLGLLSAVGKVAAIPLGPLWVWLGDHIGRKSALSLSSLLAGICGILAGFAHGFAGLLLWNTLLSAIMNGAQPVTNSVIGDSFEDKERGQATGYYYGVMGAVSSFIGPVIALFTGRADGWRWAMWTLGGLCILISIMLQLLFVDPPVGGAEDELAGLRRPDAALSKVTWGSVMSLFRIPTFNIMMLSRLLSGHLLIGVFGIQFLVKERHFTNAVAATVLIPFGLGFVIATFAGGFLVSWLDRVWTDTGRVVYISLAQVLFAAAAYGGTQLHWHSIGAYSVFWALMGAFQGMNPPVNRPIVMSVVLPELRGQAFAIFLSIFQTIGWAAFSYGAGSLAKSVGIQRVFAICLVWIMVANGVLLLALLRCYKSDIRKVHEELLRRRSTVLAGGLS